MSLGQDDCGRPTCKRPPEKTYTGPHGNRIKLCKKCYYNAVVRGRTSSLGGITNTNLDNPINGSALSDEDIIGRNQQ